MTTYKTQVNENVGYFQGKYSIDMASFINDENFKNILIEIQEYTKYFYQNLNTAIADELNITAESLQNNTSALFVKSNEMRDNVTSSFEVLSNSYKAILSMNDQELSGIAMTGAVTAATGSYIASLLGCAGYGPAYLYCAGVYTAVYGVAIAGAAYTYNVAVENCVLKA